jgi:hypothetical protein
VHNTEYFVDDAIPSHISFDGAKGGSPSLGTHNSDYRVITRRKASSNSAPLHSSDEVRSPLAASHDEATGNRLDAQSGDESTGGQRRVTERMERWVSGFDLRLCNLICCGVVWCGVVWCGVQHGERRLLSGVDHRKSNRGTQKRPPQRKTDGACCWLSTWSSYCASDFAHTGESHRGSGGLLYGHRGLPTAVRHI